MSQQSLFFLQKDIQEEEKNVHLCAAAHSPQPNISSNKASIQPPEHTSLSLQRVRSMKCLCSHWKRRSQQDRIWTFLVEDSSPGAYFPDWITTWRPSSYFPPKTVWKTLFNFYLDKKWHRGMIMTNALKYLSLLFLKRKDNTPGIMNYKTRFSIHICI